MREREDVVKVKRPYGIVSQSFVQNGEAIVPSSAGDFRPTQRLNLPKREIKRRP